MSDVLNNMSDLKTSDIMFDINNEKLHDRHAKCKKCQCRLHQVKKQTLTLYVSPKNNLANNVLNKYP